LIEIANQKDTIYFQSSKKDVDARTRDALFDTFPTNEKFTRRVDLALARSLITPKITPYSTSFSRKYLPRAK